MSLALETNILDENSDSLSNTTKGLFEVKNFMKKIESGDLIKLQAQLDSMAKDSHDPFSHSAAYFGMTGRNGLWAYGNEKGFVLISRHPNDPNSVLIFPPYGDANTATIKEAIKDKNFPNGEIEFARVNPLKNSYYKRHLAEGNAPPVLDTKLDWVCPVHIVSSENIITKEGASFRTLRQKFNQAVKQGLQFEEINVQKHEKDIVTIVDRWAKVGNKPGYSYEDLTSPSLSLIELMKTDTPPDINGVIVYDIDQNPIGYWLWHETPDERAMSLARVSIGHLDGIKGSAEFAAVKMSEILDKKGINEICLGGSETDSLNKFKEKLSPALSIKLTSLRITR